MSIIITFKHEKPGKKELQKKHGFLVKTLIDGQAMHFVVSTDGMVTHYETGRVFCKVEETKAVLRLSRQRHSRVLAAIQKTIEKNGIPKIRHAIDACNVINKLEDILE